MRVMLANLLPWANFRRTYGHPIGTRELVKRRIARLAALIVGSDALVAWGSHLIDQGYRGELECIIAKIFGSEAMKESAIELFMKTHGGRSFLKGHLFSENLYDYLAPCIYEGEGEMLGLAFFKSLVKEHGKRYFEPIGTKLQQHGMRTLNPINPLHLWRLRSELWSYGTWWLGRQFVGMDRPQMPGLAPPLRQHIHFALDQFQLHGLELSGVMQKHQLKLADRQCRMAEVSQRIQDTVVMLVTALWAQGQDEVVQGCADVLCEQLRMKLEGERPTDNYFRKVGQLADQIIQGGFKRITGIHEEEILMRYQDR
jgi:hypothetical protein